jgi:hypothetical protein
VAYLAWHLFDLSGSGGNSALGLGQIASMKEGDLSITYATTANAASTGNALENTPGGRLLLALRKSKPTMGVNMAGL